MEPETATDFKQPALQNGASPPLESIPGDRTTSGREYGLERAKPPTALPLHLALSLPVGYVSSPPVVFGRNFHLFFHARR